MIASVLETLSKGKRKRSPFHANSLTQDSSFKIAISGHAFPADSVVESFKEPAKISDTDLILASYKQSIDSVAEQFSGGRLVANSSVGSLYDSAFGSAVPSPVTRATTTPGVMSNDNQTLMSSLGTIDASQMLQVFVLDIKNGLEQLLSQFLDPSRRAKPEDLLCATNKDALLGPMGLALGSFKSNEVGSGFPSLSSQLTFNSPKPTWIHCSSTFSDRLCNDEGLDHKCKNITSPENTTKKNPPYGSNNLCSKQWRM